MIIEPRRWALWLLLGGCGLMACSKQRGVAGEIAALKEAGRTPGPFSAIPAGPFQARSCQAGTLDKIAAVLCEYGSADAAALGQPGAEGWIGQAVTGVVLRRDLYLLALADRDLADRNGKTILAISRAFRRATVERR